MSEPRIRPFGRVHVPVLTGAESSVFDLHAIETVGVPQPVLMENAGRSAAAILDRLFPAGQVVALVGAGNNGGDALVLLRALAEWGRTVRAILVGERPGPETVLHAWPVDRVRDEDLDDGAWEGLLRDAAVLVDGILGTGIRGAPRARQARAIRLLNAAGRHVLALDIPSGVDADTGGVAGDAVRADVTVCFGAPKVGALLHPGRARAGRLVAVDIGFPPLDASRYGARIVTPAWAAARRPRRAPDTHKNEVGAVLVVAGRVGMAGAAVMATRAALRSGAGLVRVASVEANRGILQATAPEAIFVPVDDADAVRGAVEASSAVVAGPGLGTDARAEATLARILEAPVRPLLLDADALNLLAQGRPCGLEEALAGPAEGLPRPVVLTPHPGEMSRISGVSREEISGDRLGVARRWAEAWGCALLLKGMPSVVAAPGEPVLVDAVGTSDLATGGMGDVLSGCIGAFLARGTGPRVAAALGLQASGRAAARRGPGGVLPEDVIGALPEALREEGSGDTDLDLPFVQLDLDPAR